MPHSGHQYHHAQRNAGGPAEQTLPRVIWIILLLGILGFCLVIMGIGFLASVSSSLTTPGIVLLIVGGLIVVLSVALWLRKLHHRNTEGGRTAVYGQSGATYGTVQPPTPGASMTYGQPGMQPIIQTQNPEPANSMFRPGEGAMHLHGAQTNLQPNVPRSPGASAPPQYPDDDPEAPPPAYGEVVKQHTDLGNMGND